MRSTEKVVSQLPFETHRPVPRLKHKQLQRELELCKNNLAGRYNRRSTFSHDVFLSDVTVE
jgi:hypothetical protein